MNGLDRDQLTSRIETLRGPVTGYAHAHAGLAAFWREQHRAIVARVASDREAVALAQLQSWLSGDLPFALVMGEDEAARTTTLARFALAALERPGMTVVFLPVSSCFGTAAEHDALQVLHGLLSTSRDSLRAHPRSPNELRWAIAEATRGDIAEGESELLVIVDGIERAADWDPDRGVHFLHGEGRGIHLLVSACQGSSDEDQGEWQRRLQWDSDQCFELSLPVESDESERLVAEARAVLDEEGDARADLDVLSVCLAPIAREELGTLDHARGATWPRSVAIQKLDALTETEPDGTWHFRNDSLRRAWREGIDTATLEDLVVQRAGDLIEGKQPTPTHSTYLVKYAGTYCARTEVPLEIWAAVASPRWLESWRRLGSGMIGYVADVRRARDAAQQTLIPSAGFDTETREALRLVVWCALLEGALFDEEANGSEWPAENQSSPIRSLDSSHPFGAVQAPAAALLTLQQAVVGAPHEVIATFAREVMIRLPETVTVAALPIPRWEVQPAIAMPDTYSLEEIRSATPSVLGVRIANNAGLVVTALGAEPTLDLARSAPISLRAAALANLVPHLPESVRSIATSEALQAFREHADRDALRALFASAPWMSSRDAAWLLCSELGNDWHDSALRDRLVGWAGITEMIPLIRQIGGSDALVDVAETIARLSRWFG